MEIKIFSGGDHPPVPTTFNCLPNPHLEGVPPFFFVKMTAKNVFKFYLDGFGHFTFGFGAVGKNLEGNYPSW